MCYLSTRIAHPDVLVQTFKLQLFIRPGRDTEFNLHGASFSRLLGAWFLGKQFPFPLADLCNRLPASETTTTSVYSQTSIPAPPFRLPVSSVSAIYEANSSKIKSAAKRHNEMVKSRSNELTFESSHKGNNLGGTSELTTSFAQAMKRFFSEVLVEDLVNCDKSGQRWLDRGLHIVSSHRRMRQPTFRMGEPLEEYEEGHISYLQGKDVPLAVGNLQQAARTIVENTMSMKGVIDHCENLGHAEIPFFDGLNVDLLPFQKQSVQWALERETIAGGIQSLFWLKLPRVADVDVDVYYNPITETFRTDKPRLCRGGIIAEEMGTFLLRFVC